MTLQNPLMVAVWLFTFSFCLFDLVPWLQIVPAPWLQTAPNKNQHKDFQLADSAVL